MKPTIRFDRNEWSGAFGDIGTDLPLITGMILVSGIDAASVLTVFGLMQIFTGLTYRIPMPVQPLKVVATLVIVEKISGPVIYGGGLAIGFMMGILTLTGLIERLTRVIPKAVIRGIQFGLGIKLSLLALTNYVQVEGGIGYLLAIAAFILTIFLLGNRKYPPALFIIVMGLVYALLFKIDKNLITSSFGLIFPQIHQPQPKDIIQGLLLLALPQLPLSLGNSIYATQQTVQDLFPEKKFTVRKIGLTYSLMNLAAPFMSGIPVCHGAGGLAGHYTFGGRTGGSVIIYGSLYLVLGLFLSNGFREVVKIFPLPILGVILFFEGIALMRLIKDTVASKEHFFISLMVGLMAAGLPYGFLVGIIIGSILFSSGIMKKY